MRVVAGELGGRRLISPDGTTTRPTTDRVREAIFNSLGSSGVLEGALVADLYAGSGAIGIEALSRGAAHCTFVERDRDALRTLEANLDAMGLRDRSRVVRGASTRAAAGLDVDIVFADPPYDFDRWEELSAAVTAPMLVVESGAELPTLPSWEVVRARRYGRTRVTFLERNDGGPPH